MDEQPQKKKSRKSDYDTNKVSSLFSNPLRNNMEQSTSQEKSIESYPDTSIRDTNNNRNKNKAHDDRSKSFVENPRKGKSIKRKSYNTHHVSFEGSQAPQSLSAQITSPRQLHTATSLANWNQPSTSNAPLHGTFLNEEIRFDDSTLENDFQRLVEAQKMFPHYQMQSTPRNEVTMSFSQENVYCSSLGRQVLFD